MKDTERQRFLRNSLKVLRSYHAALGGKQDEGLNVGFISAALQIIEHKEKSLKSNVVEFPKTKKGGDHEKVRSHSKKSVSGFTDAYCICISGNKRILLDIG